MDSRKRIREYLVSPQVGFDPASTEILNNLAESIFPHSSTNGIDIKYIPTKLVTGDLFGGLKTDQVGDHELGLLQKILGLSSENQVLVLCGPKGCGKTTTTKHIFSLTKIINSNQGDTYPGIYTPVWLNLNEEKYRKVKSEDDASAVIIEQLSNHIHSEIAANRNNWISKESEITDYWAYELQKIKEDKTGRSVFRYIAAQMDISLDDGFQEELNPNLQYRRELLKQINKQGGENRLEYLFRLLSFIRRITKPNSLFWIVIDNLDGASLAMQRAAVVITRRFLAIDKTLGIRFLVVAREETLESRGLRLDFSDVVTHFSIMPSDLIQNRIDIFFAKSDDFRKKCPAISNNHYDEIKKYVKKLRENNRDWDMFREFVDISAGRSLRNGLLIAEGIVKVHIKDLLDMRANVHDAIRVCIRRGLETFDAEKNTAIEQLFGVRFSDGDQILLIKPRILTLLLKNGATQLGVILRQMELFGYSVEHTVIPALNDMLRPEIQLLRSNGKAEYSFNEALTSTGDSFLITEIGKGYINHLFGNLDYLQEVMLDVSVDKLPDGTSITNLWLPEKIDLIRRFVEILYKQDLKEMESYLAQPTDAIRAISSYIEYFGTKNILTSTLFGRVLDPVKRLIEAEKRYLSDDVIQERGWDDVLSGYENLSTLIYNSNLKYFGN